MDKMKRLQTLFKKEKLTREIIELHNTKKFDVLTPHVIFRLNRLYDVFKSPEEQKIVAEIQKEYEDTREKAREKERLKNKERYYQDKESRKAYARTYYQKLKDW